jgi:hypothetical protein
MYKMYQGFYIKLSLSTIYLILLVAIATSLFLFLYNSFNIDLGVKEAQGQTTKPIIIEIPTGA